MLERLSKEDFATLIGRTIKVGAGAQSADLEVAEATELASPSPRATKPFRLVLRSRDAWRVPQGTFRVEHPTLGTLELFAVPTGPDGKGFCYEIIFN